MDELILMKLYTVVVYDLKMCMKENNRGLIYIKRDNYLSRTEVSFVIFLTVLIQT